MVTDESGKQVKYLEYQPYGETKVEEGTLDTAKKFTGKELDDSTGLYDYGARQYDSNIGRFISADTVIPNFINPQNLNRYSYCLNNPLRYTDSTGHTVDPWDPPLLFMDVGAYQADPSILNAAALGADVVLTGVPIAPAVAGLVVRGAEKLINKIDDVIRAVDKVGDTMKGVDKAEDAIKVGGEVKKGIQNSKVKESIKRGIEEHKSFFEKVKKKIGWQAEPSIRNKEGKILKPDAITSKGKPIELKPNTLSGKLKGEQQIKKYEKALGRKGRVVFYNKK